MSTESARSAAHRPFALNPAGLCKPAAAALAALFTMPAAAADNLADADPLQFQFINLAEVDIAGAEARFSVAPVEGVTLDGAVAWARGRVERDGVRTPLLTVDPLKFVTGISYRASGNRFGGQLIATIGSQKERRETQELCTPACLIPDDYAILDATAFPRLNDKFTLRAGLFNILDATYADWADIRGLADTAANRAVGDAWTQPGRSTSVSLTARF